MYGEDQLSSTGKVRFEQYRLGGIDGRVGLKGVEGRQWRQGREKEQLDVGDVTGGGGHQRDRVGSASAGVGEEAVVSGSRIGLQRGWMKSLERNDSEGDGVVLGSGSVGTANVKVGTRGGYYLNGDDWRKFLRATRSSCSGEGCWNGVDWEGWVNSGGGREKERV